MICIPHQILFGDQIKKNKKGEECSMHGERNVAYLDLAGNPRARYHVEGIRIGCRMRLKLIFKK